MYLTRKYFSNIIVLSFFGFNAINLYSADSLSVRDTIPILNILIAKDDSLKLQNDSLDEDKNYILFLDSLKPQITAVIITGMTLPRMKLSSGK